MLSTASYTFRSALRRSSIPLPKGPVRQAKRCLGEYRNTELSNQIAATSSATKRLLSLLIKLQLTQQLRLLKGTRSSSNTEKV